MFQSYSRRVTLACAMLAAASAFVLPLKTTRGVRSSFVKMHAPAPSQTQVGLTQQSSTPSNFALNAALTPHFPMTASAAQRTAIVTGASSGIGLYTAKALVEQGWHVILACRSYSKALKAARNEGMPDNTYTIMNLDLAALSSVREFAQQFKNSGRSLDALVCNAATWYPRDKKPRYTADGFEEAVGTNHLGHFLLTRLLLDNLKNAKGGDPRIVYIGTETHNPSSIAGKVPPRADLGDLTGMEKGLAGEHSMIDDKKFNPTKAYKDSKVCNVVTVRELHKRYHDAYGISVAAVFPGCIAKSGLFRECTPFFRRIFPIFQQFITRQYVSNEDAGRRVARVVADPACKTSGAYFRWNKAASTDAPTVERVSNEAMDEAKCDKLWSLSEKLVGLA